MFTVPLCNVKSICTVHYITYLNLINKFERISALNKKVDTLLVKSYATIVELYGNIVKTDVNAINHLTLHLYRRRLPRMILIQ